MKKIIYSSLVLIILSCYSFKAEIDIFFNPTKKSEYVFTIVNKYYDMDIDVELTYEKEESNILVNSVITDIDMKDKTDGKFATNSALNKYIGEVSMISISNRGVVLDGSEPSAVYVNGLLFTSFPEKELNIGDEWEDEKSAKPDIFFDRIKTTYKCLEINEDEIKLSVSIKSLKNSSDGLNTSRNYDGIYIVNPNGTIKSAELKLSGSSGLSEISGEVRIIEKNSSK